MVVSRRRRQNECPRDHGVGGGVTTRQARYQSPPDTTFDATTTPSSVFVVDDGQIAAGHAALAPSPQRFCAYTAALLARRGLPRGPAGTVSYEGESSGNHPTQETVTKQ